MDKKRYVRCEFCGDIAIRWDNAGGTPMCDKDECKIEAWEDYMAGDYVIDEDHEQYGTERE